MGCYTHIRCGHCEPYRQPGVIDPLADVISLKKKRNAHLLQALSLVTVLCSEGVSQLESLRVGPCKDDEGHKKFDASPSPIAYQGTRGRGSRPGR
jgi:hypothetical protein